ncbi:MAG TPA: hypothetical protein QGI71_09185 [Dehalococcoidia bacterium]|nr:hypothetical protein [Dehalococcoidia bacterium]
MSEEAIESAKAWLRRFLEAWNSADLERVRDELHYSHVTIGPAGGQVVVVETREALQTDFTKLAEVEGWASSSFDDFTSYASSPTKVHFETTFKRCRQDGTVYASGRVLYIVTEQDGRWGMQLRSGVPAGVSNTDGGDR